MLNIKSNSDHEKERWPSSVIVELPEPFIDERGIIQPLIDIEMKSSILITSNPGAIRANHYHKTDWHYMYLISGKMDYYYREHGTNNEIKQVSLTKGDMVFTPPMEEHTSYFPDDTHFLAISRNPRDQDAYETDVIRVNQLVDIK